MTKNRCVDCAIYCTVFAKLNGNVLLEVQEMVYKNKCRKQIS